MKNHYLHPLVSIIIPIYKTEKYLFNCLTSVVNQTYNEYEIIMIDDGSPDNSYIIAEEFVKKNNRFNLIRQNNGGLSSARNTGISNAIGEYLIFLDSDDQLTKNAIELLVNEMLISKSDMVIPDKYYEKTENESKLIIKYSFTEDCKYKSPIQFASNVLIAKGRAWRAHSILYKTELIKLNKVIFPIGYTQEDIIFNLSFFSYSTKISFINSPTLIYLKRKGSITSSYDDKLIDTFLFIDQNILLFNVKNGIDNKQNQIFRDSLLCRNTVITLAHLFSTESINNLEKKKKFQRILKIKRINDSFKRDNKTTPFFNSIFAIYYFKIMFYLISHKIYFTIPFLAKIGGDKMLKK